jgi:D-alanyl-D-alanine carboxypeptidase-like protein
MSSYSDILPVPAKQFMNTGLHSASESSMRSLLGIPGALTKNCSNVTNPQLKARMVTANVGPFKVTGLAHAVESLSAIFVQVKSLHPDLYAAVKTAGMLCCRHKRLNPASFSNHSWGTAIDLYFGTAVVPQGDPHTHRGVLALYPFFHTHGWYWGAGFSGKSVDSMHFELSEEVVQQHLPHRLG